MIGCGPAVIAGLLWPDKPRDFLGKESRISCFKAFKNEGILYKKGRLDGLTLRVFLSASNLVIHTVKIPVRLDS
jgi:hypothetical protein